MSVLEVKQGKWVGCVAGTEAGQDGLRLAAERKRPVTSALAEVFSTVEVKQGGLEERMGGAEADRDGTQLVRRRGDAVDFENRKASVGRTRDQRGNREG